MPRSFHWRITGPGPKPARPGVSTLRIVLAILVVAEIAVPAAVPADVLPVLPLTDKHVFVLERGEDAIASQERGAREEESLGSRDENDAKSALVREKAQVAIVKKDIEAIKARINAARKAKDKGARLEFEKQQKTQEIELRLAEKRREMREAEISDAQARKEAGTALASACAKERALRSRRQAYQSLLVKEGVLPAEIAEAELKLGELERSVLEAHREAANKAKIAAEKRSYLLGKRLETLDAQSLALTVRG